MDISKKFDASNGTLNTQLQNLSLISEGIPNYTPPEKDLGARLNRSWGLQMIVPSFLSGAT